MGDFLTTAEAAALMNLAQSRVVQLCARGLINASKFGHVWMIPRSSAARYKPRPVGWPKGRRRKPVPA
jgi:excisionase family DNA binding protein